MNVVRWTHLNAKELTTNPSKPVTDYTHQQSARADYSCPHDSLQADGDTLKRQDRYWLKLTDPMAARSYRGQALED